MNLLDLLFLHAAYMAGIFTIALLGAALVIRAQSDRVQPTASGIHNHAERPQRIR
ncbi:hypothetical protein [Rosistilla oblonga]|uniref:hypothetical protein n=1 Tax=Rosistilla oblonga TaxID=2527990 RepID=UPI003A96E669